MVADGLFPVEDFVTIYAEGKERTFNNIDSEGDVIERFREYSDVQVSNISQIDPVSSCIMYEYVISRFAQSRDLLHDIFIK